MRLDLRELRHPRDRSSADAGERHGATVAQHADTGERAADASERQADTGEPEADAGLGVARSAGASGKLARVARELSFPLICLIFGLLFLKSVLGEKVAMDTAAPSALLWVVLPLSVLAIVLGLRAALKRQAGQAAPASGSTPAPAPAAPAAPVPAASAPAAPASSLAARPVLIVLAAVLGVVLFTQVVGLLVACCVAMLVLMPALGFRRIIPVIVISGGSTIAIWLFFVKFLAVALPMGML